MQTNHLHTVYLSLGSNIGDRKLLIKEAIGLIGKRVGQVIRQSSLIETEPWGFISPNRFLNACIACKTPLSTREVLVTTQEIEKDMGRQEKSNSGEYHDRLIDIDILLYDNLTLREPGLTIPHPRMREREFVMKPLSEILPDIDSFSKP
ncbi:MAG: 2-amino-4-hydroxy-6-hydroxymethyldihydropteridine diphosphokinase [Prevotella sp.]|jgi:2-amino-4-hydroxy-6-hydroxymethyldihydropteridine diphosphokinase